jgi:hypothetical protein
MLLALVAWLFARSCGEDGHLSLLMTALRDCWDHGVTRQQLHEAVDYFAADQPNQDAQIHAALESE